VLPGYAVLDMKRNKRRRLLRHAAVPACVAGTPSNNRPQTWVHATRIV
jgi:hypothetical protein